MSKLEVVHPNLIQLKKILSHWQTELYNKAWNSLFLENHDRPRSISKYGDDSTPLYHEKSAKMLRNVYDDARDTLYLPRSRIRNE